MNHIPPGPAYHNNADSNFFENLEDIRSSKSNTLEMFKLNAFSYFVQS
jgi:hypothetical protein